MCDAVFTRRDTLTRHIQTKHDNNKGNNVCVICGTVKFSRPDHLRRHILKIHDFAKPRYTCVLCRCMKLYTKAP